MAGSLREIKAKIASIKQTSHITGAMQMVSASKLTRSEQAAKDFQIYASKIRQITTDLLHSELVNGSSNPMLDARPVRKSGYIVITSDKGLVGGYNSTILKAVLDMIKRDHDSEDEYANHHINSLSREVRVEKMLPIADFDPNESEGHVLTKFELEPDRDTILDQLLPQYAESLIYGAIVDAKTAEHAAGMTAMQTATDNAKKIINDLTIQYNRARQAAITQEITEIVGGASALE